MFIDRCEKNWWVSRAKKKKNVNMYIYYVQTLYQTYMTLAPTWYLENITQSTHMFFSLILSGSDLITGLYVISDYYKRPDQINTERRKPFEFSILFHFFSQVGISHQDWRRGLWSILQPSNQVLLSLSPYYFIFNSLFCPS